MYCDEIVVVTVVGVVVIEVGVVGVAAIVVCCSAALPVPLVDIRG
jgi:hypothetical protein